MSGTCRYAIAVNFFSLSYTENHSRKEDMLRLSKCLHYQQSFLLSIIPHLFTLSLLNLIINKIRFHTGNIRDRKTLIKVTKCTDMFIVFINYKLLLPHQIVFPEAYYWVQVKT